jgi:integrase
LFMFADVPNVPVCVGPEPDDERLSDLSKDLSGVLQKARAPSTTRQYGRAFGSWRQWAGQFDEVQELPADPLHVSLYLTHLGRTANSYAKISLAASALSWAHNIAGLDSPTLHVLVKETLNGLKHALAKPVNKKEPFEPQHIKAFIDILDEQSVTDIRNTTIITIAFYALLRFDELSRVKGEDIEFHEGHVEISIKISKADQLRQGNTVLIARLGGKYCPVNLLERYMHIAFDNDSLVSKSNYLFRRCITHKNQIVLTEKELPMSYSSIRDMIKRKALQIGLTAADYSTHSMRSGGATAAANSDVSERALQRHGRWASSASKDGYVRDKVSTRLSVSKAISRASLASSK